MRARTATPDERERLWPRLVDLYADFDNYAALDRAADPGGDLRAALSGRDGRDWPSLAGVGDNGPVGPVASRGSRPCLIVEVVAMSTRSSPGWSRSSGVGLAVGLIAGLAALVGVQVLGVGDAGASAQATAQQSLYLPKPEPTQAESGPLITLAPDETGGAAVAAASRSRRRRRPPRKPQKKEISLSASQTEVAPMEQIDLTGVYPGGEGAILQVQRFTAGAWTDFPVTVSVSDETFSTYVQTSQPGPNKFRVVDTDTERLSNEVTVKVG